MQGNTGLRFEIGPPLTRNPHRCYLPSQSGILYHLEKHSENSQNLSFVKQKAKNKISNLEVGQRVLCKIDVHLNYDL